MDKEKASYLQTCLPMAILQEDEKIIYTSIEELEDPDELKLYVEYLKDRRALWAFARFPAYADGIPSNEYDCDIYGKAAAFRKYLIDHDEKMSEDWNRKFHGHKWEYQGNGFAVTVPSLMELYIESKLRENDLWEYSVTHKKDEIVVFVYAHSSKREPTCYFQINVKKKELTDILGVDNTVLTDNQHRLMAEDYCDAVEIRISELNGWIEIPSR